MARITRQPSRKTLQPNSVVLDWINRLLTITSASFESLLEFKNNLKDLRAAWPIVEEKSDLFHWSDILNRFDELLETLLARCIPAGKLQTAQFTDVEAELIIEILEFSRILLENCSSRNIYNSYDRLNVLLRCENLNVLEKTLELILIPARKIESQKSLSDKFDNLIDYRVVEVLAQCVLPPQNEPAANENIETQFAYSHSKRIHSLYSPVLKEQLEYCRLLALSVYLMMSSDIPADVTGFSMNPTLIADTTKLVSATPTSNDMKIEIGALSAVRGFLKFDSKWTETIYALDASASHGPIATIFRTISHCIVDKKVIPYNQLFLTAFFDLATSMATCAEFDEALVTSTVIDDIVRSISTVEPIYYKIVERFMNVLDPLIQYMSEALDAFFSADGLSLSVRQVAFLIEIITSQSDQSELKKPHISYLSNLLKFILKLLTQFGSNDRLRNLIEGSLFKSIKLIFEAQFVFGADVFYYATHILSTFIHTEPTSLSILQESEVPQSLLRAIVENKSIPAHTELLTILPQAFDAICLNSSGVTSFMDSDPLPIFLKFLSDSAYFRELQQNHNAVSKAMAIGDAMNEFMRHHPNLLTLIIPNVVEAIDLLQVTFRKEQNEAESLSICKIPKGLNEVIPAVTFDELLIFEGRRRVDPIHINMLESLCLFIESICKTPAHRESFLAQKGVSKLLQCYIAPILPADFTNSQACASINHCFHVLSEADPVPVMADINSFVLSTKSTLDWFLKTRQSKSLLLDGLKNYTFGNDWSKIATVVQTINVFGTLVALLADLCFAQHMNFSRSHARIVPAILEQHNIADMMQYIGGLMRCCLWEYWALRRELPKSWLASSCRFSQLSPFKNGKEQEIIPVPAEIRVISGIVDAKLVEYVDPTDVRIRNIKACLTILKQVPTSAIAFYSGLARSLASKRSVSTVVADLSPEQMAEGIKLLIESTNFDEFVNQCFDDIYLRNRLISAGISLTNLIFIDESNFKMSLHLPALKLYRETGSMDKLSIILDQVISSINNENSFEMISVNDVLESIFGVLSRITDEALLRGAFWEINPTDNEKYSQLPYLFDFAAEWCFKAFTVVSKSISRLSIECIQLLLTTWYNLSLLPNQIQVNTNLCTLMTELRAGSTDFVVSTIKFASMPRFENFKKLDSMLKIFILNFSTSGSGLFSKIIEKSPELSYDLAQLFSRVCTMQSSFPALVDFLLNESEKTWNNSQLLTNIKIISIMLNSVYRCELLASTNGEFEIKILNFFEKIMTRLTEISDKNLLISQFGLIVTQFVVLNYLSAESTSEKLREKLPKISANACNQIFEISMKYFEFPDLSVDSTHSLLQLIFVLTKNHRHLQSSAFIKLLPKILKSSTKCLESSDSRHKSIVSLVALILRHLIETPTYLTALFQQEMIIRFKAQNDSAFEIEDLVTYIDPFVLRDISSAKEAVLKTFALNVEGELIHQKILNEAGIDDSEATVDHAPLYTLRSSLTTLLEKRKQKLAKKKPQSIEESKIKEESSTSASTIVVPKYDSVSDILSVLRDENSSPYAKDLIDCIITQLLETSFTRWPQSTEESLEIETDKSVQNAHFYRCALLLFLSELILAYPVCHRAFLLHPRASELIEFLLNVMVPYGNVRFLSMNQAYERSWVQYLLINTCMGSIVEEASIAVNKMTSDVLPETMADSCKFVIDCLFSNLKAQCVAESKSLEEHELRIGRIFGLSDTIFCLLTIKSSTVGRWAASMTSHLASLLLENQVIHHLSTVLQFIDSNNPAYEEVTINLVRTLEALCKFSNKLTKLALKRSGGTGSSAPLTDFSRLLQDFSSEDSGFSDDYGYESGISESDDDMEHDDSESDGSEDEDDISGIESDTDMDTDDSDLNSEDMEDMMMSGVENAHGGYTSSSDFSDSDSGSEEDVDDMDIMDDIQEIIATASEISDLERGADLNNVRGRNTRIGTSGPFELIVEEIDESDNDDADTDSDNRGFPVGSESESDEHAREYDFNRHNHTHRAAEIDDFNSDDHDHGLFGDDMDEDEEEDYDDDDDDEDDDIMRNEDDADWDDLGNDHNSFPGGPGSFENEFMDFPELPRHGAAGRRMRGHHHNHNHSSGFPHQLTAMLGAHTYSGQLRAGTIDSNTNHPMISRPALDPLNDPLRAHLPLSQPISVTVNTSRPMSVNFPSAAQRSSRPNAALLLNSNSSDISKVNADPFHFPQAVATNRRWQQDSRFSFNDLSRIIIDSLGSELESSLSTKSEDLKEAFKSLLENEAKQSQEAIELLKDSLKEDLLKVSEAVKTMDTSTEVAGSESSFVTSANTSVAASSTSATPVEFIDQGMDAEFFNAIPVSLYEEIIQQHLNERRNQIPPSCNRVTISTEFLDRLAPTARDMYVRMSDAEVRTFRHLTDRSNRTSTRPSPTASRNTIAFENIMDELNNFLVNNSILNVGGVSATDAAIGSEETNPIVPMKPISLNAMEAIPPVDPASLVSILRSYYSPVISERRLHHKLFQSLCANSRTRVELINLLIYVLERMPYNLVNLSSILDGYVESLTASSNTNADLTSAQAGKAGIKRSRSGQSSNTQSKSSITGTSTPPLLRSQTPISSLGINEGKTHIPVLQRTLQLLLHLCSHDEDVCGFFTSPVEKPWTIKRSSGNSGNKRQSLGPSMSYATATASVMTITTKYPLVLIMACLERSTFIESSLLIENLMHLLDTATAPLSKVVNPQDLKIEIPTFLLTSLVKTLVTCEFTPKALQYAMHLFQHLSILKSISIPLLNELTEVSGGCVDDLIVALKGFMDPSARDLKKFSQSRAPPAKFLRLIKTIGTLSLQPTSKAQEDRSQDKLIEGIFEGDLKPKITEEFEKLGRFGDELEKSLVMSSALSSGSAAAAATGGNANNAVVTTATTDSETLQYGLVLLPVIESYFLLHRLIQTLGTSPTEPSPVLIKFAEEHRNILNSLIRTKPSLLTQGSLVTLTRLPRVLDFDNKRIFFRQQLHRKKADQTSSGTINITVRRQHVFEDSFIALQGKTGEEVKWGRLSIKFADEEGVDAGGVTREWFSVLARQMFNPDYALFRTSAVDRITYQPNRMSYINPDHLLYFAFVGRIIGKAVFDSKILDCYFTRSFYKHILACPVEMKDLEAVDPELYKSFCWIIDNDITGVMDDLTFTAEADEFGTVKSVELIPDGANISVTEDNKREYVRLLTEFKLTTAIKPQIDAFLRGFHEIIPQHLIKIFNEQELELLISGLPDIDIDDWRANCEYHGGYTIASPQIQWFWRLIRSFDTEMKAKLIQFVTGTSKVPLEGFSKLQGSDGIQKFQIHRDPRSVNRLPTAHTCFNQLDLPEYETYEELRQQLLFAITEGVTGFGFI